MRLHHFLPKRTHWGLLVFSAAIFGGAWISMPFSVQAAYYNNPTAVPPGGNTANFLDTSSNSQKKIGSLMVGDPSHTEGGAGYLDRLCLNAYASRSGSLDYQTDKRNCIRQWSNIPSAYGTSLVRLYQDLPGGNYYAPQEGYVAITGNIANQSAATFTTMASSGTFGGSPAPLPVALYAYSSYNGDASNIAGHFIGRVAIKNALKPDLTEDPDTTLLCLNDTVYPFNETTGYGCIRTWADLGEILPGVDYVRLQSTNNPTPDNGRAAVTSAAAMGTLIAGDPPVCGGSGCPTCGDGQCTNGEAVDTCPVDCQAVAGPGYFLAFDNKNGTAHILVTGPSQPYPGTIVIFRSTDPSFSFTPMDGAVYQANTIIGTDTVVVFTSNAMYSQKSFDDTFMITGGRTYYYRVFAANKFPIYNHTPWTQTLTLAPYTAPGTNTNTNTNVNAPPGGRNPPGGGAGGG